MSLFLLNITRKAVTLFSGAVMTFAMIPAVPAYATTLPTPSVELTSVTADLSLQSFLSETNKIRLSAGIAPLQLNDQLTKAAQNKVADMIAFGYWDHFRPGDQKAPWEFIAETGYTYVVAGENLARGFKTAQGITAAWYNSPSHRANLLSERYEEVGFATAEVLTESGQSQLITVQMFGKR